MSDEAEATPPSVTDVQINDFLLTRDNPFAVMRKMLPPLSPDAPDILTHEIMEAWLETGAPPCEEIEERFGLYALCTDFSGRNKTRREVPFPHISLMLMSRQFVTKQLGFAIPCREAIEALVQAGPLIEVGAGTGFWAALIQRAGGDIIATDLDDGEQDFKVGRLYPVQKLDATEAVLTHPDRTVLTVWPSNRESWPMKMIPHVKRDLIFIGEGSSLHADDEFFEYLDQYFQMIEMPRIPRWPCINDWMRMYRRVT